MTVIVVSRRTVALAAGIGAVLIAGIVLAVMPAWRDSIARAYAPVATADPATLEQQRTAAEHSIQRGYAKATGQLDQVRTLKLSIGPQEATAIDSKARSDLATTRRQALAALGGASGLARAELDRYVTATEGALDAGTFEDEAGRLLAPGLLDIVRRANALFQDTADVATRALTRTAGSPSPTATANRTAVPTPTPR